MLHKVMLILKILTLLARLIAKFFPNRKAKP